MGKDGDWTFPTELFGGIALRTEDIHLMKETAVKMGALFDEDEDEEPAREGEAMGGEGATDELAPAGGASPGAVVAAPTEERGVGEDEEGGDVTMAEPGGEKRPRESHGTPPRPSPAARESSAGGEDSMEV